MEGGKCECYPQIPYLHPLRPQLGGSRGNAESTTNAKCFITLLDVYAPLRNSCAKCDDNFCNSESLEQIEANMDFFLKVAKVLVCKWLRHGLAEDRFCCRSCVDEDVCEVEETNPIPH